jgi:hypothetical protein
VNLDRRFDGLAEGESRVAAVRIEALADPSLPHGGPGRADNGNFGLTELTATFTPNERSGDPSGDDPPKCDPVAFARALSTFDQAGLPVAAAIDGNDAPDSACWAVDPQFGRDHAAVFELAAPLDPGRGGVLELTLHFDTNVGHSIGRLRMSLAADAAADLRAPARSAAVAAAFTRLAHPTPADRALLARFVRERDPDWRKLRDEIAAHEAQRPRPKTQKALICSEGVPAIRLHTQGGDFLEATHYLKRGDPGQKLEVATPAFLQVLTRAEDGERRWQVAPPAGSRTPLARAALARWLTDVDDGAGSLLARVCVNRLWQHLFGRGSSPRPPTSGRRATSRATPELLDWLACELVESGWSVKHVVALLATSRVYLEAGGDEAVRAADPDERLFSRHAARRLEAEAVRDAMLAVSGRLDPRRQAGSAHDVADPRRSVYLFVKRSRLVPMLSLFDAPNALSGVGRRQVTTVAPQSLFLMNHPAVRDWSAAFARRSTTGRPDFRAAPMRWRSRAPSDDELAAVAFLAGRAHAPTSARRSSARTSSSTSSRRGAARRAAARSVARGEVGSSSELAETSHAASSAPAALQCGSPSRKKSAGRGAARNVGARSRHGTPIPAQTRRGARRPVPVGASRGTPARSTRSWNADSIASRGSGTYATSRRLPRRAATRSRVERPESATRGPCIKAEAVEQREAHLAVSGLRGRLVSARRGPLLVAPLAQDRDAPVELEDEARMVVEPLGERLRLRRRDRPVGDAQHFAVGRRDERTAAVLVVEVRVEVVVAEEDDGPVGRVADALLLEQHELLHGRVRSDAEVHRLDARQRALEHRREGLVVLDALASRVAVAEDDDAAHPVRLGERVLAVAQAARVAAHAHVAGARLGEAQVEVGAAAPADLGVVVEEHRAVGAGGAAAGDPRHDLGDEEARDDAGEREPGARRACAHARPSRPFQAIGPPPRTAATPDIAPRSPRPVESRGPTAESPVRLRERPCRIARCRICLRAARCCAAPATVSACSRSRTCSRARRRRGRLRRGRPARAGATTVRSPRSRRTSRRARRA